MLRFIGGDEPYLVDKEKASYLSGIKFPEFNYLAVDSLTEEVVSFLQTEPFMDPCKIVYCIVDDISALDVPLFDSILEASGTLIVRFRKHDARKTFFKKLKEKKLVSVYGKQEGMEELRSLIPKYCKKLGISFAPNAYEEFLSRENYEESPEVSIYTIMDDVKKLSILSTDRIVTKELVKSTIEDRAKGQVFSIAAYLKEKNVAALSKQARLLAGSEIQTLSALLREYRIAYKAKYFSTKDIGVTRLCLSYKTEDELLAGMDILTDTLRGLKVGSIPTETAMLGCFLRLL